MDLIRISDLMLIFILETRLPASDVEYAKSRLSFDGAHGIDAVDIVLTESGFLEVFGCIGILPGS